MTDPERFEENSAAGTTRQMLLIIAAVLTAFISCVGVVVVALVLLNPTLRNQVPLLAVAPASNPPPEAPQKFTPLPPGPVNIVEDFAQPSDRWELSQTRMVGGTYEMSLERAEFDTYGLFLGEGRLRDFDLAVDAMQTAGPLEAEFGIRFRQRAPDDHLMFSISPSGYFRLVRVQDENYTPLVAWTQHPAIRTGPGVINRLRLIADGPQLTGFINGTEVLSVSDPDPQVGQLTLGLVTFAEGGLVVRFDNLEGFALIGPTAGDQESLRLDEDFSNPADAPWSVGGAVLRNGGYELSVGGPVITWQQPLPVGSSAVGDHFILETEAQLVEGGMAEGSGYGLMFADDGEFDFMSLVILPQGGIMLFRNGPEGGLIIPPTLMPAVNPGVGASNHIRIEAQGEVLRITINGQTLPELELPPDLRISGRTGIMLQSSDERGLRVRFSEFRVEERAGPAV
ncbi:hypothetical protein [Candidatus Viridilinea mediisalina]|uniref:3-keto-disaccharide hydrolase domain-containing protein n=1 Tax=Candidatus Viridilinea mediisalina TaxID=2024553 RepID=A0A2A6RGV4_9CHLR|nr:hypothetical protein [Candidatus Viridilinea mediisalina]PDW02090.1 hypothetical protein CJ255_15695 [Candidatus Viridilinea mediisalina]